MTFLCSVSMVAGGEARQCSGHAVLGECPARVDCMLQILIDSFNMERFFAPIDQGNPMGTRDCRSLMLSLHSFLIDSVKV
jgi:hypothetical protein